ncbi:MAG: ABC transporter ATP-binding protein [Clostridia bacterium]
MGGAPLRLENLTKRYGSLTAVDHLNLEVPAGAIFGLLGPNGAGKTTTLEMTEGLRAPDEGHVYLGDVDVIRHPEVARRRFGVQLQTSAFFELLTVRETLALFRSLYPKTLPTADLIRRMGLEEKADARVGGLSGGQRQRLALAVALVNDPEVVFLDEPSAGLDPQARRNLWDMIAGLKAEGRTVVLTTHYMDEAEVLSDSLAIMDHGHILDSGTPRELIERHLPSSIIELAPDVGVTGSVRLPAVVSVEEREDATVLVTSRLEETLVALVDWAGREGRQISGLRTRGATLEDVFLKLTGRSLRE